MEDFGIIAEPYFKGTRMSSTFAVQFKELVGAIKEKVSVFAFSNLYYKEEYPINEADDRKNTLLHYATYYNHIEIVEFLINHGASPNLPSNTGYTPLHWAVINKNTKIVQKFIEKGAQLNVSKTLSVKSPLFYAVRYGNLELTKILVENGADIKFQVRDYTLLQYAAREGYEDVTEYLIQIGADIDHKNEGWTALHFAAKRGHLNIVKLLVRYGAKMTILSKMNESPLFKAIWFGHFEIVKYLLDHGAPLSLSHPRYPNKRVIDIRTSDPVHRAKRITIYCYCLLRLLDSLPYINPTDLEDDNCSNNNNNNNNSISTTTTIISNNVNSLSNKSNNGNNNVGKAGMISEEEWNEQLAKISGSLSLSKKDEELFLWKYKFCDYLLRLQEIATLRSHPPVVPPS